jgi:peptidoglycan/xylan/chitin deacetylase (PgdA/CDA1 family)
MAEPTVAVSFDDGPHPYYTPKVLNILKRRGVPATFFTIGIHPQAYADLVRRARDEGHEIGNHTWSHPDLSQVTQREADWQLSRTHDVLGEIPGQPPTLFRPPYGKLDCVGLRRRGAWRGTWSRYAPGSHLRPPSSWIHGELTTVNQAHSPVSRGGGWRLRC